MLDDDEIDLTLQEAALPRSRRRQLPARRPAMRASPTPPRRSALQRSLRGRSAARRGRSARVRQVQQPPNPHMRRRWVCTFSLYEAPHGQLPPQLHEGPSFTPQGAQPGPSCPICLRRAQPHTRWVNTCSARARLPLPLWPLAIQPQAEVGLYKGLNFEQLPLRSGAE